MLYQAELFAGRGYGERSCALIERRTFGSYRALRDWSAGKLQPIYETSYNVSRALDRAPSIRVSELDSERLERNVRYLEPEVVIVPSVGETFGVDEGYMR